MAVFSLNHDSGIYVTRRSASGNASGARVVLAPDIAVGARVVRVFLENPNKEEKRDWSFIAKSRKNLNLKKKIVFCHFEEFISKI